MARRTNDHAGAFTTRHAERRRTPGWPQLPKPTTAAIAVLLVGVVALLGATPAMAGFARVHRSSTATSSQVNHFTKMLISDVGVGQPTVGHPDIPSPRDGLGDVVAITSSTFNGQTPGLYRIQQVPPGSVKWGVAFPSYAYPVIHPPDLVNTGGETYTFVLTDGGGGVVAQKGIDSQNTLLDSQVGELRTHPPVALAYGQISSSPTVESGLIALLDNDVILATNLVNSVLVRLGWFAPPAGTNRVCGGSLLAGDITGDGVGDLIQYGTKCGGGDSGFQVWAGQAGSPFGESPDSSLWSFEANRASSFVYRGYVSVGTGLRSMQLGDLNGDGKNDLAFTFAASTTSGDGAYAVALYNSTLTLDSDPLPTAPAQPLHFGFAPTQDDVVVRHTVTGGAGPLQIADVAAPETPTAATDGRPDLVIAQPQSGRIIVLANNAFRPGNTFTPYGTPTTFADGQADSGPDGLTLGAINNDGRQDLVAWSNRANDAEWDVYTAARAPTVTLSSSATANKTFTGTTVQFTATTTAPAASPLDAEIDHVDWDFDGNGTVDETTSTSTVDHSFSTTGDKDVAATVVNTGGDQVTQPLPTALTVGTPLHVTLAPNPSSTTPGTATDYTATATGGYPGAGGATPSYTYAFTTDATSHSNVQTGVFRATWAAATRGSVSVTVDDGNGQSDQASVSVRVAAPLTVSFAPQDGHNLMAGEARTLIATASGGIGARHMEWDTDGDGTYETDTGTATTTSVSFPAAGTPTVGVQVTDADPAGGVSASAQRQLIVRPVLNAAFGRSPAAPAPGDVMTFDAGDSTGGEPIGATPYTYEWTVDGNVSTQTGAVLTHTFAVAAHHTVDLKITDAYGRTETASENFKVAAPLTADFATTPVDPQLGEVVHFDPGTTIGGIKPYTYAWDLDGDGSLDPGSAGDAAPTHTFTTKGIFHVTLQITDADGVVATTTRPVGIAAELTADLRVLPAQPAPGTAASFDATTTVGGTHPYSYAWTVDGTPQTGPGDDVDHLQRTFTQPGHHTVALTVTDQAGRTSTVAPQAFKVAAPVTAAFTSSPSLPQAGERIDLDATGAGGGIPPLRYAWDLDGNGTYESSTAAAAAQQVTFATAGVKTIGLQVTDDDGIDATVTHNVQIAPALTAALTHSPAIPVPGQSVTLDASRSGGGAGTSTFAFDTDNSGAFATLTGAAPTTSRAFTAVGDHPVAVRVTDAGGHALVARDLVTVADPLVAALALSPDNPETGDALTLDASGSSGGAGARSFRFDRDGDGVPDGDAASTDARTTVTVDRPGTTRFGVVVGDTHDQRASAIATTDVTQRLVPDFKVPAIVSNDLPATFDATPTTGGAAPLRMQWDLDGNGSYETDAGTKVTQQASFPKVGQATVGLQGTDALGHEHNVRKTFTVVPGCIHSVTYGLAHITSAQSVCLRRSSGSSDAPLTANGDIALNGMTIVRVPGSTLQVIPPSEDTPPQLIGSAVRVRADGENIVNGPISWVLPVESENAERQIGGVTLPPGGLRLLGLSTSGRVSLALGTTPGSGTPYVRVGANLEIPSLKLTSETNSPSVTAKTSFRIDAAGEHRDSMSLKVSNAKLKGLEVKDVCLAYVAAGQAGDRCPQFEDHRGEPFMTCPTDDTTDRWSGTMDITLPVKGGVGMAFSGELQNGSLANLAAKVELGDTVELAPDVHLRSIAAGVCLTPSPLKIRGAAKLTALPDDDLEVDGSFLYTDPSQGDPWSIELAGDVTFKGNKATNATLKITGDGEIAAGFRQRLQLPDDDVNVASIEGGITGWIKGTRFNFEGDVKACLAGTFCIGGDALVSSDGVAACVTLFTIYYPIVHAGWLHASIEWASYDVKAGFGYRWGGGVDVMGGSCSIGPWRPEGAPSRRAGSRAFTPTAPYVLNVKAGSPAETLRLHGATSPPDVTVTGPDGTTFSSSALTGATQTADKHLIVQNPTDATTVIQLVKPAAGAWTITPALGSAITSVDTAQILPPPSIGGRVHHDASGYRLDYAYTPQAGIAFRFIERRGNLVQDIGHGQDGRCPRPVKRHNAAKVVVQCGSLPFHPLDGPAGQRTIDVQITRDGVPLSTERVASYVAPPPPRPSAVHQARLTRGNGHTVLGWRPARGAVKYEITATSTDGYRRLYVQSAKRRTLLLPRTRVSAHVDTGIVAVGANGRRGHTVRLHLRPGERRAGATPKRRPAFTGRRAPAGFAQDTR